tara:strand:+ start:145 stop:705 length:561 start_codon:yes stop_codon:yes gene_type:complete
MTNNIKYSVSVLFIIIIVFFINQRLQNQHTVKTGNIFTGNIEDISKITISEKNKILELVKTDSIWSIAQADSMIVKENQLNKIFDKILPLKKEMLITNKKEKWEKFGVDDSLGRHFKLFDNIDNELIHYVFGNSGNDYQRNYIRENNSSEVYRTNDNVYYLLNSNVNYWGSKPSKQENKEEIETTK